MVNRFVFAPPRQGKTLFVVQEAIERMKRGRKVLSNFPIATPSGLFSNVWKPEYIYQNVQDSYIIIDESQRDYDSQTHKTLSEDEDVFFATSGHNNNEVVIVSQNLTRVAKAVRDRMNEFIEVKTFISVLFLRNAEGRFGRPLILRLRYYDDIEKVGKKDGWYMTEYVLAKKEAMLSYDTHFFKKDGAVFTPISWAEEIKRKGGKLERLTERANEERQKSLSPAKVRGIISSGFNRAVSYINVSRCNIAKRCQILFQKIHKAIALRIRKNGIFSGAYFRGKWFRSSSGSTGSVSSDRRYTGTVAGDDGGESREPVMGSRQLEGVLSGNDPAETPMEIHEKPGLALAGCNGGMEGDHPEEHPMEPQNQTFGVQQGDCPSQVARKDKGGARQ